MKQENVANPNEHYLACREGKQEAHSLPTVVGIILLVLFGVMAWSVMFNMPAPLF